MVIDDDKTPTESPMSILREIKALREVTQRVVDNTLEIQGDIRLIFNHQAKLDTRILVTFGIASSAFVLSLFSIVLSYVR